MTMPQANSLTIDNSPPFPTPVTSVSELVRRELKRLRDGEGPLRSRKHAIAVGLATARQMERGSVALGAH
jgi:hypothetical protein